MEKNDQRKGRRWGKEKREEKNNEEEENQSDKTEREAKHGTKIKKTKVN